MDDVLFLAAHVADAEELIISSKALWNVDVVFDNQTLCTFLIKKNYRFLLFDFEAGSTYPPDILQTVFETRPCLPVFLLSRQHCYFIERVAAACPQITGCFGIPYHFEELYTRVTECIPYTDMPYYKSRIDSDLYTDLQGTSTSMQTVRNFILDVAKETDNVLLYGESGSGKEVAAALIHKYSANKSGAYLTINSRCINDSLAESILFGSCKGAFTGAVEQDGLIAQAHDGTLFLDEIETLSLDLQAKLLRVLETHEFYKVGGKKKHRSNFRLICATNQDLPEMIDAGAFRADLFYRINVFHINMPPLRRHKNDIELLASEYLKTKNKKLSSDALKLLQAHSWPGNIRELFHCLQRAVVYAKASPIIYPQYIDI